MIMNTCSFTRACAIWSMAIISPNHDNDLDCCHDLNSHWIIVMFMTFSNTSSFILSHRFHHPETSSSPSPGTIITYQPPPVSMIVHEPLLFFTNHHWSSSPSFTSIDQPSSSIAQWVTTVINHSSHLFITNHHVLRLTSRHWFCCSSFKRISKKQMPSAPLATKCLSSVDGAHGGIH